MVSGDYLRLQPDIPLLLSIMIDNYQKLQGTITDLMNEVVTDSEILSQQLNTETITVDNDIAITTPTKDGSHINRQVKGPGLKPARKCSTSKRNDSTTSVEPAKKHYIGMCVGTTCMFACFTSTVTCLYAAMTGPCMCNGSLIIPTPQLSG